ncbi:MAG TPA: hypothetical protein VNM22_16265 [Candidatus Limnocylindrales bacterium]|nr:hypothetical protein [Candidatus Limnocylindrales bacterium]
MAFTVQEYLDLVRLLAEHPEWRSELRRLLLSEELLELPQIVRELAEAQRRAEGRLERLEATVAELAEAQRRTEERLEALAEAQRQTEEQLRELIEAQRQAERRLEKLESTTKTLVDRVGDIAGRSLEAAYREKAMAYFGPFLRKPRVIAFHTLEEVLETQLSSEEFKDLLQLDLLVKGKPRSYPHISEVLLAVEISTVVDQKDLDRAQRRAALLRRAGYQVIPVVAGEQITPEAEDEARLHKIAVLQDGRISFWDEALQTWITP